MWLTLSLSSSIYLLLSMKIKSHKVRWDEMTSNWGTHFIANETFTETNWRKKYQFSLNCVELCASILSLPKSSIPSTSSTSRRDCRVAYRYDKRIQIDVISQKRNLMKTWIPSAPMSVWKDREECGNDEREEKPRFMPENRKTRDKDRTHTHTRKWTAR